MFENRASRRHRKGKVFLPGHDPVQVVNGTNKFVGNVYPKASGHMPKAFGRILEKDCYEKTSSGII